MPPSPDEVDSALQLAAALTRQRVSAGLTVREVARQSGIPASTLGGYFSGRNLPPATRSADLDEVLRVIGVPEQELGRWRVAAHRARTDRRSVLRQRPGGVQHDEVLLDDEAGGHHVLHQPVAP